VEVSLARRKTSQRDPTEFLDVIDNVNVFLLGPEAAIREKNRKKARKEFRSAAQGFSAEFNF